MDELTQKEIEQYMTGLPQKVKDIVLDDFWQKRTVEIAVKYSLSSEQSSTLQNLVMFVIIGVENPNTLKESLKNELGISELLSEQINDDLEVRVFDYIVKSIQNKEKRKETETEKGDDNADNDIPEVRPENLPATEPGKIAHDIPKPIIEAKTFPDQPAPTQRPSLNNFSAPKQEPVSVPNYSNTPVVEKTKPVETVKPIETAKKPEPVSPPPKKYAVDPYREPIE